MTDKPPAALVSLRGVVERDVAALVAEQLAGFTKDDAPVTVDMSEAEIEDSAATVLLVEAFRQTAARVGALTLNKPPQAIAHTLYRIGALEGAVIEVKEPREEIGTSS